MTKIGLFGGTFDPVHIGHLIIAQSVHENLSLDITLFIPSAYPPHKGTDIMFSPETRYAMLSRAIEGNPHFEVSDIEMKRKGPSYTIDTIRELKTTLTEDTELTFIVGRDNLPEISMWKEPDSILEECRFVIADRPSVNKIDIPEWMNGRVASVNVPLIDISSSWIRSRIRSGKNIRYLVPDVVSDMIDKM